VTSGLTAGANPCRRVAAVEARGGQQAPASANGFPVQIIGANKPVEPSRTRHRPTRAYLRGDWSCSAKEKKIFFLSELEAQSALLAQKRVPARRRHHWGKAMTTQPRWHSSNVSRVPKFRWRESLELVDFRPTEAIFRGPRSLHNPTCLFRTGRNLLCPNCRFNPAICVHCAVHYTFLVAHWGPECTLGWIAGRRSVRRCPSAHVASYRSASADRAQRVRSPT